VAIGLAGWSVIGILVASVGQYRMPILLLAVLGTMIVPIIDFVKKVRMKQLSTYIRPRVKHLIIVTIIFLFCLLYFSYFVWQMTWAPPGDAVYHSTAVSIISETGRLPVPEVARATLGFSLHPSPFGYPPGFHVLAAMPTTLLGVYPGQSVVFITALASILIPSLSYAAVYSKTKSHLYAAATALATFFLAGWQFSTWPQHDLLTANLLNGTYPTQLGNLYLIALLLLIVTYPIPNWAYWAIAFGILVTYPGYFTYVILWSLVSIVVAKRRLGKVSKTALLNSFPVFFLIIVPVFLYDDLLWILSHMYEYSYNYRIYGDWLPTMLSFPYFIIFIITAIASASCIYGRSRNKTLYALFFSTSALVLLAFNEWIYQNLLFMSYVQRFFPVYLALTFFCLPISFFELGKKAAFPQVFSKLSKLRSKIHISKGFLAPIALMVCLLLVLPPYLFYVPSTWGRPTGDDLQVLTWISQNIPPQKLILNDRSFVGLYLPSLTPKKIVNTFPLPDEARQKAYDANRIFDYPSDYNLTRSIINKWGISYIYVSSDRTYRDPFDSTWRLRSLSNEDYLLIFCNNPFLAEIYRKGQSAVFEVLRKPRVVWSRAIAINDWNLLSIGEATSEIVSPSIQSLGFQVSQLQDYAGASIEVNPPNSVDVQGFIVSLWAKGDYINRSPTLHGYIYYSDGSKDYYQLNLESGTFDWKFFQLVVGRNISKEITKLEIRVGMLWGNYTGTLYVRFPIITWRTI
jgi:hypothetical protein